MESIKNFYSRLFSLSRNYGFTMVEMAVALFILSLSIVFLVSLANNYLYILNSYRQRFIALSMAQEGIELAIALRNKQIETTPVSSNWLGVNTSSNCLKFNTSTSNIEPTPTSEPCEVFPGYKRLVKYSDFQNPGNPLNAATSVKIVSEVSFGKGNTTTLDLILIKWHPVFYEF
jgi:prepilin-type N-terminal cleavage/methylation domain-containing protein